jgi:hypothetical protein
VFAAFAEVSADLLRRIAQAIADGREGSEGKGE